MRLSRCLHFWLHLSGATYAFTAVRPTEVTSRDFVPRNSINMRPFPDQPRAEEHHLHARRCHCHQKCRVEFYGQNARSQHCVICMVFLETICMPLLCRILDKPSQYGQPKMQTLYSISTKQWNSPWIFSFSKASFECMDNRH